LIPSTPAVWPRSGVVPENERTVVPIARGWVLLDWTIAALASLAFALTLGLNYPYDNQVVYFLEALRHNDPTLLSRDWYATEVTHYHPAITRLVAPLLWAWPSGWGIAVLHEVVIVSGCLGWYAALRRLVPERRVALFALLLTLTLMTVTKTLGVAVSYVFNESFQPSTMGSLGLLLAVAPFIGQRWLLSGVMLGVSGLFHANFLVLNLAAFGLAHLTLGGDWRSLARRLALQLGPSLLAFVVLVVPMLATVASENAAEAQRILFEVRSPHHYVPRWFQRDLVPFAAWSVLGLVSSKLLTKGTSLGLFKRWMLATAVVVWAGTLLTSWEYVSRVAQLFVWRIAPFLDLAGQSLFCLGLVRAVFVPRALRCLTSSDLILLLVSASALGSAYSLRGNPLATEAIVTILALGALAWGLLAVPLLARLGQRFSSQTWVFGSASAAVLATFVYPALAELPARSTLLRPLPENDQGLYDWVRQNTDRDARFLSPPEHQTFRYEAERAIVVDWKCTPMLPDEVLEWFERIRAVTGRPNFKSYRDLEGYNQLTVARIRELDAKYDLDYVLVPRGVHQRLKTLKAAFLNPRWAVLDVRDL
jgi:hypothetical protein